MFFTKMGDHFITMEEVSLSQHQKTLLPNKKLKVSAVQLELFLQLLEENVYVNLNRDFDCLQ